MSEENLKFIDLFVAELYGAIIDFKKKMWLGNDLCEVFTDDGSCYHTNNTHPYSISFDLLNAIFI